MPITSAWPSETPHDVKDMINDLDRELRKLHAEQRRLSADEANERINSVIDRFKATAQGEFKDRRDRDDKENHEGRIDRGGRDDRR